jgi:hypothetical protein
MNMTNLACFDERVSTAAIKAPCRAATGAAITLSGLQTIDGVALAAGDRVLVKAQPDAAANGIWVAAAGAWSRALDFLRGADALAGTLVFVAEGAAQAGTLWKVGTANPFTLGSDPLGFEPVPVKGDAGMAANGAATRIALAALPPSAGHAYLTEPGREGLFVRDLTNHWDGRLELGTPVNLTITEGRRKLYTVQKVSGGSSSYNATFISATKLVGDFLIRFRRTGDSFDGYVGVNETVPAGSAPGDMKFRVGFGGGTNYAESNGHGSGSFAQTFADYLFLRRIGGTVTVLTGAGGDVADATLRHTYTGTNTADMLVAGTFFQEGAQAEVLSVNTGRQGTGLAQIEFIAPDHWDGRPDVEAFDAKVTVEKIDQGFGVTKVSGGAAFNGAAVTDHAFTGDYELWARKPGLDSFDSYIGVAQDAKASAGADLAYAFSLGAGTMYLRRNGVDVHDMPATGHGYHPDSAYNDWYGLVRTAGVTRVYINVRPDTTGAFLAYTFDGGAVDNAIYEVRASIYQEGARLDLLPIDVAKRGTDYAPAKSAQGYLIPFDSDPSGASGAWKRVGPLYIEHFGAKGDGVTDDTAAHQAASALINAMGGGELNFTPGKRYLVGGQTHVQSSRWAYGPERVLTFRGGTGKLTLNFNGAEHIVAPGRYGSFDPATGAVHNPTLPFVDLTYRATPVRHLLHVTGWQGPVEINAPKFDGQLGNMTIGGLWGDTGNQIAYDGIFIELCPGGVVINDENIRGFGRDGLLTQNGVYEKGDRPQPIVVNRGISSGHGRQGYSLTGGDITLNDFTCTDIGFGGVFTQPAAGFDSEPEANTYGRFSTNRCWFGNSAGPAFVMYSGRTEVARHTESTFVGTVGPAIYIKKPNAIFDKCRIVGGVQLGWAANYGNLGAITEIGAAPKFTDCTFTDDPIYSPTGEVYISGGITVTAGTDPQFTRCIFNMVNGMLCPAGSNKTRYIDCYLRISTGSQEAQGEFYGTTYFVGTWDLHTVKPKLFGTVYLNGVQQFVGDKVHSWGTMAAGATASTTVTVPGARVGDERAYRARGSESHVWLRAEATADNVVTVYAHSPAGGTGDSHTLFVTSSAA